MITVIIPAKNEEENLNGIQVPILDRFGYQQIVVIQKRDK